LLAPLTTQALSASSALAASSSSSQSATTIALTARANLLQDENDELYELLKGSEVVRLKEELGGVKKVVGRLETALTGPCYHIYHCLQG